MCAGLVLRARLQDEAAVAVGAVDVVVGAHGEIDARVAAGRGAIAIAHHVLRVGFDGFGRVDRHAVCIADPTRRPQPQEQWYCCKSGPKK